MQRLRASACTSSAKRASVTAARSRSVQQRATAKQPQQCQQEQQQQQQEVSTASRRAILLAGTCTLLTATALGHTRPAPAAPLAPLGGITRVGGEKLQLTPDAVKGVLAKDIGQRMYFVTGELTPEIFSDTCVFKDPTNEVTGLARYVKALDLLFDPTCSKVELLDIKLTGPNVIEADWRMGGWLRTQYFPWKPKVDAFQGHTVYTLDADGLIVRQDQTWSISGLQALQQTFTPGSGPRVAPL